MPSAKRGNTTLRESGDDLPGHIPGRRPQSLVSKMYYVEPHCGSDTMHSRPALWPAAYRQEYPDHTHDAVHLKRRQLSKKNNRAPSEEEPFTAASASDSSLPQRGNLQCARWSPDSLHSRICRRQWSGSERVSSSRRILPEYTRQPPWEPPVHKVYV